MFFYSVDGLTEAGGRGGGAPRSLFVLGALLVIALNLVFMQLSRDGRGERAPHPCPLSPSELTSRLPFNPLPPHLPY